jgi:hypothetical protein
VAVTVTLGMAAPDGSLTVPARPEVPADWAMSNWPVRIVSKAMVNFMNSDLLNSMVLPLSFRSETNDSSEVAAIGPYYSKRVYRDSRAAASQNCVKL